MYVKSDHIQNQGVPEDTVISYVRSYDEIGKQKLSAVLW